MLPAGAGRFGPTPGGDRPRADSTCWTTPAANRGPSTPARTFPAEREPRYERRSAPPTAGARGAAPPNQTIASLTAAPMRRRRRTQRIAVQSAMKHRPDAGPPRSAVKRDRRRCQVTVGQKVPGWPGHTEHLTPWPAWSEPKSLICHPSGGQRGQLRRGRHKSVTIAARPQ